MRGGKSGIGKVFGGRRIDREIMKSSKLMNNLYGIALFVLFVTSYIPLFILIAVKQVYENYEFLQWGDFSKEAIKMFLAKYGIASFLIIISLFGLIGCKILFLNLQKNVANGENVTIIKMSNRNSESIGYIATYIIPFMFQGFNTSYEIFAIFFLLFIVYRIYINSNLLLINPVLNFKYSIFEIEYEEQNKKRREGLIITRNTNFEEDSNIKIYPIGFKLFYATK